MFAVRGFCLLMTLITFKQILVVLTVTFTFVKTPTAVHAVEACVMSEVNK